MLMVHTPVSLSFSSFFLSIPLLYPVEFLPASCDNYHFFDIHASI